MTRLLDQNLKQLEFIDPNLADRMRAVQETQTVRVVPTRSGVPSALAISSDGVEAAIHSLQDPRKQARRFVKALEIKDEADTVAVIGIGLGYHVAELIRRLGKDMWILLIESREDVFRAALGSCDLGFLLNHPKVRVFVGEDYIGFLDWLKDFLNTSNADSITVVRHMESYRLNPSFYGQIQAEMERGVSRRQVELNTLVQFGPELETNVIRNLPRIVSAVPVSRFEGAFKGVPGFLVAAGPTLSEALPHLREVQDRALIIVADTATRLLLREGIRPHFTAILDMHEVTGRFYKDLNADEAPALLFDPDAYFGTISDYPGPRVTFDTIVPWTKWAATVGGEKGTLEKGISVAHTEYQFLRFAGVDPIILVGVDLAFPGKTTHAEGVVLGWGTGEVTDDLPNQLEVPSVTGGMVNSAVQFKTFVTVFEVLISQTESKVINTSPSGALIRGAENLPVEEAIRRHVTGKVNVTEQIRSRMEPRPEIDWDLFRSQGENLLKTALMVTDRSASALRWLKQTRRLDWTNRVDKIDFDKLARRINKNRIEILGLSDLLPLFQRTISGEALAVRALSKQIRNSKDEKERHELEQKRMEQFFAAYGKAAAHLQMHLGIVLEEIPA